MKKKCIKCKQNKTPDNFNKNARYSDNKDSMCKQCRAEKRIEYKANYIPPSEGDAKILEIKQEIRKVSKLPKSEQYLSYDKILCAVASMGFDWQTDILKDTIHGLMDKLQPVEL